MRRTATAVLAVAALAVPSADAWAAAHATVHRTAPKKKAAPAKKKVSVATRRFAGTPAQADRWGELEVTILVRRTTTTIGKKQTVARRITSIGVPIYPSHTGRSIFINQQALPMLVQETLQAQSANIQLIGGATYSSEAFQQSLQAAILQARKW